MEVLGVRQEITAEVAAAAAEQIQQQEILAVQAEMVETQAPAVALEDMVRMDMVRVAMVQLAHLGCMFYPHRLFTPECPVDKAAAEEVAVEVAELQAFLPS